ncbi:MAG: hypothetical protein ACI4GD_08985 [Lachnospiraceae bacterium]
MAKYTIKMGCGHEETISLFGKDTERKRKIEYYENFGLCTECYKKKQDEQRKSECLLFKASVLPYIDNKDGSILLFVWFDGDTKPHKEEIKSLGYRWDERESADDWYLANPSMCWGKTIKLDSLPGEIEKAVSIGANNLVTDSGLFAMVHYHLALEMQKEWKEKRERIESISKPDIPEILKGHRWNQKIYGRPGFYSVYLDGNQVTLTDAEADEIRIYQESYKAYQKQIKAIQQEASK